MIEKIKEAVNFIKSNSPISPDTGIILGSGLGALVDEIEDKYVVPYQSIPYFPQTTVEGHSGNLIIGKLNTKNVVVMQGRFHYYEGYTMSEIVFPVRVMKFLGINQLFLSNASGAVNPDYEIGDLMILSDHINLLHDNPLIGKNIEELGPRFPDMSEPYNLKLIEKSIQIAINKNIKYRLGVYAAVSGPCFETPAEYERIRNTGADVVGMSTVPEVIAARHMDLNCFAISIITDLGVKGKIVKISHEDVIKIANKSEKNMTLLMKELLK